MPTQTKSMAGHSSSRRSSLTVRTVSIASGAVAVILIFFCATGVCAAAPSSESAGESSAINTQSTRNSADEDAAALTQTTQDNVELSLPNSAQGDHETITRRAAPTYPHCKTLQNHLVAYQAIIQSIETDIDTAVAVAQDIVDINDQLVAAQDDVCGLMHALSAVNDLGVLLGKLPYVGDVLLAMSAAANAVLPAAQTLCSALGDLETIVKDPAEAAGEIVDGAEAIKEKLDVISDSCGTAITLVSRAELVGSQICALPLNTGCGYVVTGMVAGEAVVKDAAQKLQSVIDAAPEVTEILSTLASISSQADSALRSLQDTIGILNTLSPYLDYIPSCTPAIPSECENIPYPCGTTWVCCGKVFGHCVCTYPNPKICYSNVCTPYVPPVCTPSLDMWMRTLGITIPTLPGIDFLNVNVPGFPSIAFPESLLTLNIALPTCILG